MLADCGQSGPGWKDEAVAEACRVTVRTVENVRKRLVLEGLESALNRKPQVRLSRQQILDGEKEAKVIALCCGAKPSGHARWTLRLLAERLVEAGVPFVTVHWSTPEFSPLVVNWDTHADNFLHLKRDLLPTFDRLYSALLDDLAQRGLLETTLVLAMGEMGRTPKWDDPRVRGTAYQPGRDHWPHCMFARLHAGRRD